MNRGNKGGMDRQADKQEVEQQVNTQGEAEDNTALLAHMSQTCHNSGESISAIGTTTVRNS